MQNGRHQGCSQLGKEQNELEEASSLSECSSPIEAAYEREEPWGKATWWLSLAQTKGKARASQGQRRLSCALRIVGKPPSGCP